MVNKDKWGYEINTSSSSCISSINSYYEQVLSYGRKRDVIMEAVEDDPNCVLANILAAHFSSSSRLLHNAKANLVNYSLSLSHFISPSFHFISFQTIDCMYVCQFFLQVNATPYEKSVFQTIDCLMSPNRDDDLALHLHAKVPLTNFTYLSIYLSMLYLIHFQFLFQLLIDFPKDLVSLKRAQVLCFYMGRPDLSLQLVQQVGRQVAYLIHFISFHFLSSTYNYILLLLTLTHSTINYFQVLPTNIHHDFVYGMLAFPLLELGRMGDAEKAAKMGFQINNKDPWSQHAVSFQLLDIY